MRLDKPDRVRGIYNEIVYFCLLSQKIVTIYTLSLRSVNDFLNYSFFIGPQRTSVRSLAKTGYRRSSGWWTISVSHWISYQRNSGWTETPLWSFGVQNNMIQDFWYQLTEVCTRYYCKNIGWFPTGSRFVCAGNVQPLFICKIFVAAPPDDAHLAHSFLKKPRLNSSALKVVRYLFTMYHLCNLQYKMLKGSY